MFKCNGKIKEFTMKKINFKEIEKAIKNKKTIIILGVSGIQGKTTLANRIREKYGYGNVIELCDWFKSEIVDNGYRNGWYVIDFGTETLLNNVSLSFPCSESLRKYTK